MPSVSICIPTYKRSQCLAELLDSIIAQGDPDVEVVISDDASPDDTEAVVQPYLARMPRLRYVRQPRNIGLDDNFLELVRLATGDYVWFMGDDDRLEPGAIAAVKAALESWPDAAGMTLGVIDYASDFSAPTGMRRIPPTQLLEGPEAVFGKLADLLGFMSTLVVNRRMWNEVCEKDPVDDFHNLYLQVYVTGRLVSRFRRWGVLATPCVGFRSSNDQFLSLLGWLSRMKLDVESYAQIARDLFADNPRAFARMQKDIFDTHVMARIRNAKTAPGPTPEIAEAIALLARNYGGLVSFWTVGLPTLLAPKWLLRNARAAYQRYSPNSGTSRAKRLAAG